MSCIDLLNGLDPTCEALTKVGGVNKRVWIGQKSALTSFTTNGTTFYVETFTFSVGNGFKKFIGKRDKHFGNVELVDGENVNTFNHIVNLVLYHLTPADKIAIEGLCNAEDLFVLLENNAGQIEVFGIDLGLNATAGTGGTGTLLNDSTAFTVTLSGENLKMPRVFKNTGTSTLADNITYLDGLVA